MYISLCIPVCDYATRDSKTDSVWKQVSLSLTCFVILVMSCKQVTSFDNHYVEA